MMFFVAFNLSKIWSDFFNLFWGDVFLISLHPVMTKTCAQRTSKMMLTCPAPYHVQSESQSAKGLRARSRRM